jgi:hypothetical protein
VIIVDLNQVMLSNLMVQLGNHINSALAQVDVNMVRHMVLNSLRSYKTKFSDEYGELVIACDNTNIWRKKEFVYYKANRKKSREDSGIDWKAIFDCMGKIRAELKEFFPYRVIDVESAEADDIIATLSKEFHMFEKILIMSGDKDFIQLQKYSNVKQYDPVRKKWIDHENPARYLREHILKGDTGDGIPNVLSSDNCFVIGERQKPLTKKRMDALLTLDPEEFNDSIATRNFFRNQTLIDLSFVPGYISDKVIEQYESQTDRDRSKLLNYFIANKLKNLMVHLPEF